MNNAILGSEKYPVLFLVFNRPDTTIKVLEQIMKYAPTKLYVAADAPRLGVSNEEMLCTKVKQLISDVTDGSCEIETLYREENLGCKIAVSSAIDWFFSKETAGIILEDDCLPNQSFFSFCSAMLTKYADDNRVMHISGNNFQLLKKWSDNSYYFSNFNHIWGWATWRRAWQHYDVNMTDYPDYRNSKSILSTWGSSKSIAQYWTKKFDAVYYKNYNTWDYQWTYSVWKNNGLSILPENNLVQNIGFGNNQTHINAFAKYLSVQSADLLELKHPNTLSKNWLADYTFAKNFQVRGLPKMLKYFKSRF